MREKILVLLGLAAVVFSSSALACGVERWSVKTGTDADAGKVDLNNPIMTALTELIHFERPSDIPRDGRAAPFETQLYQIEAVITKIKHEGDGDYHLVLTSPDDSRSTMVAEIPEPDCVGAESPFLSGIHEAQNAFDAFRKAGGKTPVKVTIKGVGFFDFAHGQTGGAPNVFELHPVLGVQFH